MTNDKSLEREELSEFQCGTVIVGLDIDPNLKNQFNSNPQELESVITIRFNLIQHDIDMGQCY